MADIRMAFWCILLSLCITLSIGADSRCPSFPFTYKMQAYKNKCFQFYYGTKTWTDAKDYCWQKGGRLAMLNDRETYTFVKNTLNSLSWNADSIWIGLNDLDTELDWSWIGKRDEPGVDMTWSNWHEEHPAGWFHGYRDCVAMQKDDGAWLWHEAMCNTYPWAYRFICEYDMISTTANNHNGLGGIFQPTSPTTRPPTTTLKLFPGHSQTSPNAKTPSGEHLLLGENVLNQGEHGGLSGDVPVHAETKEKKDGHVPLYAVIVSFGAGILFACFIILFILLRRRRRRKETTESFPNVVYHAQAPPAGGLQASSPTVAGGAVAMAAVCDLTGKSCKSAIVSGSEKCSCSQTEVHPRRPGASTNVYVAIGDDAAIARDPVSDVNPSTCSSMRDMSILDEEPPTYDEACAGIVEAPPATEPGRCENVYSSEPGLVHSIEQLQQQPPPQQTQSQLDVSHQGAIPKAPKKSTSLDTYLPMNGSPKSQGHNRNNSNQYVPMSLGELPPIPTDQGYEIPVSSKLEPEAVKSLHSPLANDKSVAGADCSIYAEIPELSRNSRHYRHDEEQIYQTID